MMMIEPPSSTATRQEIEAYIAKMSAMDDPVARLMADRARRMLQPISATPRGWVLPAIAKKPTPA